MPALTGGDLAGAAGALVIDLRYAQGDFSGIARFSLNLVEGLAALVPQAPVRLLVDTRRPLPALGAAARFARLETTLSPWRPDHQLRLARALRRAGIKVLLSPDSFAPLAFGPPNIVVLHDITPLRLREHLRAGKKARYTPLWRAWLGLQLGRAARIVTVSHHAAADIAACFRLEAERIHVVPNAVPQPAAMPPGERANGTLRLLYVGRQDGNKNIDGLVRVLASLRARGHAAELVVVGASDPRFPQADALAAELGLEAHVHRTGHVDEARLHELYGSADVFLFLSRYEGFGLPPLEAMAHGVPVVAGNRTALPEVLDDAALLVDPDDPEAAADAVERLLHEPGLAAHLRERGLERARGFTIERQAKACLAALRGLWP